ncbi:MAG: prolyl oligopeptidase family serine peptidase [Chloroflexota bacterium]|nr:prolyl oligopeptidase family serine peptidase [Chloroflexota bacterium]
MHRPTRLFVLLLFACLLNGCVVGPSPAVTISANAPAPPRRPNLAPPVLPTPDPYAGLAIDDLAARSYGAGELRIEQVLGVSNRFTRTLISFDSDNLRVVGFMNVPTGEGPFPVVIVNHGYIDPAVYTTLTYTTRYADALAAAGYLAIHPNLRNYPPSDAGPNEFRIGFAVDVLNLIGLIRKGGGQPGALAQADPAAIGLWGHSMGGGVTLRTITVSPHVRAAILYGAMSGDEARNHERILFFSNNQRGLWEADAVPDTAALQRISPVNYLDRITAAVGIHHGEFDEQVPLAWSEELCTQLQTLEKTVDCFTYAGMAHTFQGDGDALFIARTIDFFDQHLR